MLKLWAWREKEWGERRKKQADITIITSVSFLIRPSRWDFGMCNTQKKLRKMIRMCVWDGVFFLLLFHLVVNAVVVVVSIVVYRISYIYIYLERGFIRQDVIRRHNMGVFSAVIQYLGFFLSLVYSLAWVEGLDYTH